MGGQRRDDVPAGGRGDRRHHPRGGAGLVGNSNNNNLTGERRQRRAAGPGRQRPHRRRHRRRQHVGRHRRRYVLRRQRGAISPPSWPARATTPRSPRSTSCSAPTSRRSISSRDLPATDGITHAAGAGIVGNSNNNNLTGGIGNDVLLGQGGNDRIDGGVGVDNMSGGIGDDTFFVDNEGDLTSELAVKATTSRSRRSTSCSGPTSRRCTSSRARRRPTA